MPEQPVHILHVDDEPHFAELTANYLEREDNRFTIQTATSVTEGLDRISDRPPDCIISDYEMPGHGGLEFLRRVRDKQPEMPFILFTGKGSEEVASEAISAGVTDYLQKGTGTEQYELLANRIDNAIEARRATQRVARQEELMRLTELAGATGGWELDLETEELVLTDGARRLFDLPNDSLSFEEALDLFHPDDRDAVQDTLDKAAQTGEQVEGTWRVRTDGGEQQILDVRAMPVSSNGETTALRGAVNDATERYRRSQELEQIIKTVPGCVVKLDAKGEFIFANERAEEVLGLDNSGVVGRTYNDPEWDLKDPNGNQIPDKELPFQQIRETGEPIRGERLDIEWSDGTRKLLLVNGAPLFNEDGSFDCAVFSLVNVTDSRERQRELRLLQQALDDVDVAISLVDPSRDDNPLVYVNDAYEKLTGYSEEEALGRNWLHTHSEDADSDAVSALREAIEYEIQTSIELRNYRKDGTEFWDRVTITPIYDEDGELVRYLGTREDITERKEREQRLEETTRQLQAVLDTVNAAVVIKDVQGEYQYANEKARKNLGVGVNEDIVGLTDHDLFPADVAEQYQADDQRVIEAGETIEIEEEVPTPEGTQINQTLKSPFYTVDDELVGICAVSTDITEHKERERRLTRTKTLISKMEELADVGAWEYDPEAGELTNTAGTKRIYGSEEGAELTLEEAFEFFHPADRDRLRDRFEMCLETGEPYEMDVRVVTANGEERWVTIQGERVKSNNDAVVVRGYSQDITARKERLARLEQIETLFQNAQDMLFVIGHTERGFVVRRVNKAFERATGLSNEQLQGKTPQEIFGPERGREIEQRYQQCLDAGEPLDYEEAVEEKSIPEKKLPGDSEYTYWETKIAPVVTGDNNEWIVGATRDINERKRRQRELEQQNERLDEFASVVSHDLRNPLQIAEGRLELAQADCDSAHLDNVADALDRMETLIEDVLTLARGGETAKNIETVSVSALAERCWEVVPVEGATLTVEADQTVSADQNRLQQLLENLFANAATHGGQEVTVRVGGLADGFYVADDGVGISHEEREDIFEPGYSTTADGTGFGLRIVKKIADAHGWNIRVTDSDDGGARFEFTGVERVD